MRLQQTYAVAVLLSLMPLAAKAELPGEFEPRGEAAFRFLGMKLYDARLYTENGAAFDWKRDFALEITYAQRFSRDALVKSTMDEIARLGRDAPDAEVWKSCFRSVSKGHQFLAVTQGANRLDFILNGRKVCSLNYSDIARSFMEIFLGENTRSASFTRALRGG